MSLPWSHSNTVHPRWRGEQPSRIPSASRQPRFIPAGAGNRPTKKQPNCQRQVHPRWRGEQSWTHSPVDRMRGSSPLARGTEILQTEPFCHLRFIPAGAGNSIAYSTIRQCFSVHPRWRGEQIEIQREGNQVLGSSPLARGTVSFQSWKILSSRFIPAGAGNRQCRYIEDQILSVHPRWRGEQFA